MLGEVPARSPRLTGAVTPSGRGPPVDIWTAFLSFFLMEKKTQYRGRASPIQGRYYSVNYLSAICTHAGEQQRSGAGGLAPPPPPHNSFSGGKGLAANGLPSQDLLPGNYLLTSSLKLNFGNGLRVS